MEPAKAFCPRLFWCRYFWAHHVKAIEKFSPGRSPVTVLKPFSPLCPHWSHDPFLRTTFFFFPPLPFSSSTPRAVALCRSAVCRPSPSHSSEVADLHRDVERARTRIACGRQLSPPVPDRIAGSTFSLIAQEPVASSFCEGSGHHAAGIAAELVLSPDFLCPADDSISRELSLFLVD